MKHLLSATLAATLLAAAGPAFAFGLPAIPPSLSFPDEGGPSTRDCLTPLRPLTECAAK